MAMLYLIFLLSIPSASSKLPQLFHGDLIILGDSFSDDGIRVLDPVDHYGFKRYSNGPVWPEYLANMLGLVDACGHKKPTINYSFGGTLSGYGNYNFEEPWTGILWQIDQFLNQSRDLVNPSTTIFFIQGGGNDLFNGEDVSAKVAENLLTAVETLSQAGFNNIVLFTIPDLSRMPGFKDNAQMRETLLDLVEKTNEQLQPRATEFMRENPQVELIWMDFDSIWGQVEQKFKYPYTAFDHVTMKPSHRDILDYAWFDEWHLSTRAHKLLARSVETLLRERFGRLLITPWQALRTSCRQSMFGN